jgi:eukaryotic-like serine/threonine-protein kinase
MQGEINQRLGDYEILGMLGAGGMGRVYRVRHVISDRIEAMKILLPDLAGRQDLADRFLREIKLVASLNHPNIATLCTALTIDNQLVMVMEFVDGVTLSQKLEAGPIRIPDALGYLDQGLAALGYAHSKGIIHRDIKPANMMLTPAGVVKLMDFGIAHADTQRALTQTGTTLGSIDYMSPEQIMGQATDARSDLYSVGVSCYEMVTGQRPFRASSDFELMAAHVKEMPKNPIEIQPWMPARLSEIIMKTIAKAPEDRFQKAEDLREALRSVNVTPVPGGKTMMEPPVLTMVEGQAISVVKGRSATIVESHPSHQPTMLVANARDERRMTEVATTPVYTPPPVALAVRDKKKNTAIYVVCGAVVAVAAAAVPIYRMSHTADDTKPKVVAPAPEKVVTTPPAPTPPATHPSAKVPPAALKAQMPTAVPPQRPNIMANGTAVVVLNGAQTPEQPKMTAEQKSKLDELEPQIDQLNNRASAVNNSLNTMQHSMQKDGLALRGDIVSRQMSMNTNLGKAKQAFAQQDPDRASRYAALTETDVKQLETFLGR